MPEFEGPTGLEDLIPDLIARKSWQARLQLHQVFIFWDDVVGPDIARRAQPQVIKGTVLWVGVSDSAWMQQLQFETQYLMETINARLVTTTEEFGEEKNQSARGQREKLYLTGMRLSLDPSVARQTQKKQDIQLPLPAVDQARLLEFTGMLSSISDLDLKQSMIRVWLAMHRGRQQG